MSQRMNQRSVIFIADAYRDDAKLLLERADEKLIAFVELEAAISGLRQFDAAAMLTVHRSLNAAGVQQMALPKSQCVVFRPACF